MNVHCAKGNDIAGCKRGGFNDHGSIHASAVCAESAVTQRWIIAEVGKRSREKHTNPDAAERNYDDYNVIPARLPDGNTFVADGALWREEE